jgi:hypothetical protein
MIFSFRPCLVIFLVLLQCIAPLVHAHTGENFLAQGLHIPGLEIYTQSVSVDALKSIPSATVLPCKVSLVCRDTDEGQVVGVDAGLHRDLAIPMQRLYKIIADLDHDTYLASSSPAVFKTGFSTFAIALHISTPSLIAQLANATHPARAPPAHS